MAKTKQVVEQEFLGCCLADPDWIDKAITKGVSESMFSSLRRREIWNRLVEFKTSDQPCTVENILYDTTWKDENKQALADEMVLCEAESPTSIHAKKVLASLIWRHKTAKVSPIIDDIKKKIESDADKEDIVSSVNLLQPIVSDDIHQDRKLSDVANEAEEWARAMASGLKPTVTEVTTGIPSFDKYATPIQPHEYVVVTARTSHGKTSMMAQMTGHNLRRGLRVAYFSIESSDRSVLQLIASQYSKVNLRFFQGELAERQAKYFEAIKELKDRPLLIFDHDTSLSQIQSKCRGLAQSFKPDIVFLDYINIIGTSAKDSYERLSYLSECMISLRKTLECALIVGSQLNRGNEKEDRRPERTDMRDSGSMEEDAHRIIALHRPKKDLNGMEQTLDRSVFDYELLQLKLRDGPCAATRIKFNAPWTLFYEESNLPQRTT